MVEIIVIIIGILIGWLIADLAYIQGVEPKGKFYNIFLKYLLPKNWKWLIVYLSSSGISTLVSIYFYNSLLTTTSLLPILALIVQICVAFILLHAAIVDISCFQIIINPVIITLVVVFLANIALAAGGNVNNIVAGAVAAAFMFIIINVSKKKGMGEGDLLVFILMGLTLGLAKLIIAFYVMIFTGSIVGLIIGAKQKKIKGIKIPFVPFMMIGFITALIWGDAILFAYLSAFFLV